ncbi:2 beta-glucan [Amylostereum chailletii]|nr:2 beta-glucan [Amylostereum chailletii]
MRSSIVALPLFFLSFRHALAATYQITDSYQGSAFLEQFNFKTFDDPTHGYVNYVDRSTAQKEGLVQVSGTNFTLRADDQSVPRSGARGRDSVRIESKKTYGRHVSIYNVVHMPKGCGRKRADAAGPNAVTLHTSSGCSVPHSRKMTGTVKSTECSSGRGSNTGCGVTLKSDSSFGQDFNSNQGGFYAMERAENGIRVWFWKRGDKRTPKDVLDGDDDIDTRSWGTPDALFPDSSCDIDSHFTDQNIVINLTFCGDWAGSNAYSQAGCPGTFTDFVKNDPREFSLAYFSILWVKVYE